MTSNTNYVSISVSTQQRPGPADVLGFNESWAKQITAHDENFFKNSAEGQQPRIVWIGCADSRVPEGAVTASLPGSIFVHRNIANQCRLDDISTLSSIGFAVDHLRPNVPEKIVMPQAIHIVVVGHTGCGGVAEALEIARENGNPDLNNDVKTWLGPLANRIKADIADNLNADLTDVIKQNVKWQVDNIKTKFKEKENVYVHGWLYDLGTGRLEDLRMTEAINPFSSDVDGAF